MNEKAQNIEQKETKSWQARFFAFWGGQLVSMLGSQIVGFAFSWYLTKETGSATILSLATMMHILPQIILGPIAGALVDRWNRKRVMIISDTIVMLFTVLTVILFAIDYVQIWMLFIIFFIRATAGVFQWSAKTASVSLMVPDKHLSRISGLDQAMQGVLNIVCPVIGALLMEVLPMQGVLMVDVVTASLGIGILFFIPIPQPAKAKHSEAEISTTAPGKPSVFADVWAGLKYVAKMPGLIIIMLMAMAINMIVTPAFSLLPLMVHNFFALGAKELGYLQAAMGVGIVVGGLALGAWGGFKNRMVTVMLFLFIMGGSLAVLGLISPAMFWLAIVMMAVSGLANPFVNGPIFAVLQSRVDHNYQGRVFALLIAASSLASPIGLGIAGPVADNFGIQIWFLIGGLVCVGMAVISVFIPSLMQMDRNPKPGTEDAAQPAPAIAVEPVAAKVEFETE